MPPGRQAFFFAIVLLFCCTMRSVAAEVVIVRTSDAEPYVQAETALRQQLSQVDQIGQKFKVKSLLAREASDKGIDASIGKPDVVIAIGTAAAKWLHKQLPGDEKLIYCMVSNPAEATLLQGHACLGVTADVPISEQIKLMAETLPHARSVGLIYHSDTAEGNATLTQLRQAMPGGWRVEAVAVNDFASVAAAIDALMQKQIDIAWTTADPKLYDSACVRTLLLTAVRSKIPVWGYSQGFVRAGALLGASVDPSDQGRQAADLIIKTVAEPGGFKTRAIDPDRYQIAVNKIVAEQIGVEIPDSVSRRAAFVFQAEK